MSLALGTVAGFAKGNFLILLACVAAGALFTIWLHRYLIRTVWLRGDQPSPFGSYRAFPRRLLDRRHRRQRRHRQRRLRSNLSRLPSLNTARGDKRDYQPF
ncbi:MAG: hypothetical protein WDN45_04255 [Caulobacteraceae bacterium]